MDQLDSLDRNKKLFPQKMWDLIHDERYQFCLRWSEDGQLVYLNRDEFEESYLKKPCNQFNTQKSISFVRQMNMYGFRKVDDCYYENDNFKRDCYHLLKNMIRRHPNKAPFNDYFPTTTLTNNQNQIHPTTNSTTTQLPIAANNANLRCDPTSFETTIAAAVAAAANSSTNNNIKTTTTTTTNNNNNNSSNTSNNNANNNHNNHSTTNSSSIDSKTTTTAAKNITNTTNNSNIASESNVFQNVFEAIKNAEAIQNDLNNLAANEKTANQTHRADNNMEYTIEPAHNHHLINSGRQNPHHYHHHNQQQQTLLPPTQLPFLRNHQQYQFHHPDGFNSSSTSPISDIADDDIMDSTQHQHQSQILMNQDHFLANNTNNNNSSMPLDHSSLSHSFVETLLQLHHQQPQDLSSHNVNRMSKSSSSSSGCNIRTPSPTPEINRFVNDINNSKNPANSHNSNNGSISSTPSQSPSIDNNNMNLINGHNFQQQLSNMVLSISNQALQFGNNNCPIKYDPIQVNEMVKQAKIPPELQLEYQHQIERQQQLAQLPPVSPLTRKLVSEICSRRDALLDPSALLDAARYTEKFLNVLLDDALLIAQHSASLGSADTAAQSACPSIDASSLTLALKLLPSKLLSSLQICNK